MTLKKINILEYAFGQGGGGHQKAYAVYAFINVDNCERPHRHTFAISNVLLIQLRRFALAYFHSHGDATGVFSQCIPGNCRIDAFRQPC